MRNNGNYIKIIGSLIIVCSLYAFAGHRSNHKKISTINIEFPGNENLYISETAVNKLLIQKYGSLKNIPKEKLVLNTIEEDLQANEMVKSAQVYLTVNGELTSRIVQRRPIGRIEGDSRFYVDDEGKRMPLSKDHSARVPIITGKITGDTLKDAYVILNHINKDEFLRKNVIGIHINDIDDYQLKFRVDDFVVNLGDVDNLDEKFNNFKAFYTKASKDKTLEKYETVSLKFNNQVVCTKI